MFVLPGTDDHGCEGMIPARPSVRCDDRGPGREAFSFRWLGGLVRPELPVAIRDGKYRGKATRSIASEPHKDPALPNPAMWAWFRRKSRFGLWGSHAVMPLWHFVSAVMHTAIRSVGESTHRGNGDRKRSASFSNAGRFPGYGRARLWLGVSAVGTFVLLATLGLLLDLPVRMQQGVGATIWGQANGLLCFVLIYAAIQLPFDLFGGYLLPKRFGRSHPRFLNYLLGLARGATAHAALMFLAAAAILLAGRWGGIVGTAVVGLLISLLLLRGRVTLAKLIAPLRLTPVGSQSGVRSHALPITMASSRDEGFTGAIIGVWRPRRQLVPGSWHELLDADAFEVAASRRLLAVKTGSWTRGRAVALLFTLTGLTMAAWLVGPAYLGTVGGTIKFSLWFTLWSFVGLLTLPTLSRRGVMEIDERALLEGHSPDALRATTRLLDDLQDGEPIRPVLIETIFHPVPSVQNRLDGPRTKGRIGFWDAARSTLYLSLAGLGLLGRAVHCNCGRPSLWVFLPTD
jgi:hypothetical protein